MARKKTRLTETTNALGHPALEAPDGTLRPIPKDGYSLEFKMHDMYASDTETTTEKQYKLTGETRVWAWGMLNLADDDFKVSGSDIGSLITTFRNLANLHYPYPAIISFHNLKFDFAFIENALLSDGYVQTIDVEIRSNTKGFYSVLRNKQGQIFNAVIKFGKYLSVELRDFAKIMPTTLANIGAALDIPKRKELIDYHAIRMPGYKMTPDEEEYLWDDILILKAGWLEVLNAEKEDKLTRSGYAYLRVKQEFERAQENPDLEKFSNFNRMFPPTDAAVYDPDRWILAEHEKAVQKYGRAYAERILENYFREDTDIAKMSDAYVGGLVFANPKYIGQTLTRKVVSVDRYSMYSSEWVGNREYPCGQGVFFTGFYDDAPHMEKYPLYIQQFKARFELKKGGFPMLPKAWNPTGKPIYSSRDLPLNFTMSLCKPDMELFFDNYNVTWFDGTCGWMFKSIVDPFANFVYKYGALKEKYGTKEHHNPILKLMAKLTLNGSYGKFGQAPFFSAKVGVLDDKGVTRFHDVSLDSEEQSYLPMAIFTTAYARDALVTMCKRIGMENVIYCDTDSVKFFCDFDSDDASVNPLLKPEVAEVLNTDEYVSKHNTEFGSWDAEAFITEFKVLREKCYIYKEEHVLKSGDKVVAMDIKAAGLPDDAKDRILLQFDDEGRIKFYEEKTGEIVWGYKHEVPEENHKPLWYPVYKPWEEVFDNFAFGVEYEGCLTMKQVKGGVILIDATKILTQDLVLTYEKESGEEASILDLYL